MNFRIRAVAAAVAATGPLLTVPAGGVAGAATAGCTWSQYAPATASPVGRIWSAWSYDPAIKSDVLYGGNTVTSTLEDSWTFGPAGWTEQAGSEPGALGSASIAYDGASRQLVLFGGAGSGGSSNTTWVYTAHQWVKLSPATSPSARYGASMAYDPQAGGIVLFGGFGNGTWLSDTWLWNGTTWVQLTPTASPTGREGAEMAYDATSRQLLLYGGSSGESESDTLGDTWAYVGGNWSEVDAVGAPGPDAFGSMSFDAKTRQLLLVGGSYGGGALQQPWSWTGTRWVAAAGGASNAPAPEAGGSMTYDANLGALVLFGGQTGPYGAPFSNATWVCS